jgi:recombination protein RecR
MARIEYPEAVGALVEELRRLPGVGPRSAERIAIWLLQNPKADPAALAATLGRAKAEVISCPTCGFFATAERCAICADASREPAICVVEQPTDVLPLERSGVFKGRYHCLGGKLSPLDNVTPDDLRIGQLLRRIEAEKVPEVILAPGSDVEGEATANYLASLLRGRCHITRIAQGLPAGGGLEHADALTLARAMEGRRDL